MDNQTHKKNARVVAGNTSLESFGPVVRDSLATKVITAEIAVSLGDLIISITNMLCWKSFCPCGNSSHENSNENDRKNVEHLDEGIQKNWLEYATEQNIPQNEIWLHAFQVEAVGNTGSVKPARAGGKPSEDSQRVRRRKDYVNKNSAVGLPIPELHTLVLSTLASMYKCDRPRERISCRICQWLFGVHEASKARPLNQSQGYRSNCPAVQPKFILTGT